MHSSFSFSKQIFFAICTVILCFAPIGHNSIALPSSIAAAAEQPGTRLVAPPMRLNVPIPGLTLDPVAEKDGLIQVNFLPQYIGAIFNYVVGISVIAAAIMIVYGGFLSLLGSTGLQVTEGKNKIKDALIGLCLILGAYTIVSVLNKSLVTLKTLEIPGVKTESYYLAANGTTGDINGPNSTGGDMGNVEDPDATGSGPRASQQPPVEIPASELIDKSTLPKYIPSLGGPENLNAYCTKPKPTEKSKTKGDETKFVDSYSAAIKNLARVVLGFGEVCVNKLRCAYIQGGGTTLSTGKVRAGANAQYAYKYLAANNSEALILTKLYPSEDAMDCRESLLRYDFTQINTMPKCTAPLQKAYSDDITKKFEENKVYGADCGGFVSAIFNCAGEKWNHMPYQNKKKLKQATTKVSEGTIYYSYHAIELFKDYPAMIVAAHLNEDIEALAAKKGGVKFGDIIYVTDGVGTKNHFLLWTGGRPDVPFSIIDMGGGRGAAIPGISVISGVQEHPPGLSLNTYVRKLTDPGGTSKYNAAKGAIFIWRPYTEKSADIQTAEEATP